MTRIELSLFADYFQFYLLDDGAPLEESNFAEAWTPDAFERQLAAMPIG